MAEKIGRFLVAVGAVIENTETGKILLLYRSPEKDYKGGMWEHITGRISQFEDPYEGLKREVKEESGLDIEIVKPLSLFHIFRGEKVPENELIGIMFWCKTDSEEVTLSEEATDYRWVSPEEALELLSVEGFKRDTKTFMRERGLKRN